MRIGKLTVGERWFLWRLQEDLSQVDAADRLGVSRTDYRKAELLGRTMVPDPDMPPVFKVSELSLFEKFRLLRRRSGFSRAELAALLECSQEWVRKMEHGEADSKALSEFWHTHGTTA